MISKAKKRIFIVLLCFIVAILIYIPCNFRQLQISLSLKMNWNVTIPHNDVIYHCYTDKVNYYVCKIPIQRQNRLCNQLIKQDLNTSSIKEVISDLEEMNVEDNNYPLFESIDYSIKKTKRLSHLFLLYSSNSSVLYIIEYLD